MSAKLWSGGVSLCLLLTVVPFAVPPDALPLASAADADKVQKKLTIEDKDSKFRMEFVLIPPTGDKGFMMGSTDAERGEVRKQVTGKGRPRWPDEEGPRHKVILSKLFYLGKFEVTQKQYKAVMEKNPSHYSRDGKGKDRVKDVKDADLDDFPVESVSWNDTEEFLRKLNDLAEKKKIAYRFRLPTEAEWEYACRAGADVEEPFTFKKPSASISHNQANFWSSSPFGGGTQGQPLNRTCKVGKYDANPFGLHDMHGNVREWCSDWHAPDAYKEKDRKDPHGPADVQKYRVLRGGSYSKVGLNCRSAQRGSSGPGDGHADVGFRVVCVPKD
jgi:formylglycine-generating enzyme required for sulfatase activity